MFNFKNFPKSLAFRHQKLQCYNLAEEGGYLRMFVEIGSGRVLYTSVDGFLQDTFLNYYIFNTGLLVGRGKKSQISRDFQGQIHGKNGRFRGNFEGIFEASFAEKRLGASRANFAGKRLLLR